MTCGIALPHFYSDTSTPEQPLLPSEHMPMLPSMLPFSIVLLRDTTLIAQNRRADPGRFLDPDGKPVANATVTAVRTHVARTGIVPRDIVTTTIRRLHGGGLAQRVGQLKTRPDAGDHGGDRASAQKQ